MRQIKNIDRREFLKRLGAGAAGASAAALAGCGANDGKTAQAIVSQTEIPTDGMTYRVNPTTGDKVSLLGYGCMRWLDMGGGAGSDAASDLDQETINSLVDYAIAHGVNYFDTSPAYCIGRSERATGIADRKSVV